MLSSKQNVLLPIGSDTLKIDGNPVTPILPIAKELLNEIQCKRIKPTDYF